MKKGDLALRQGQPAVILETFEKSNLPQMSGFFLVKVLIQTDSTIKVVSSNDLELVK